MPVPDLSTLPAPPSARLAIERQVGEGSTGRLIHGDNLPALAALRETHAGRVQCVYIDPPYNTGTRFTHYDDTRGRAGWLRFMAARLVLLRDLLHPSGSLVVQVDDNEVDYLRVLLDRVFGDDCLVSRITVSARSPSAFSTVNKGMFKASEYLLWVARDKARLACHPVRVPRDPDPAYTRFVCNPDDPPEQWRLSTVQAEYKRRHGGRYRRTDPAVQRFIVEHARQVFRLAPVSNTKAGADTVAAKQRSAETPGQVLVHPRVGYPPVLLLNGQQILTYDRNVTELDGQVTASVPLTNIWTDIAWEGIAREGGVRFKQGKKPEKLLRRVLQLTTRPGDLVLDAFGGSGTTAAVAHKMHRRWVLIEEGPQCHTHALPRLERVVAGTDDSGVSAVCGFGGGGGFAVETVVVP